MKDEVARRKCDNLQRQISNLASEVQTLVEWMQRAISLAATSGSDWAPSNEEEVR